MKRIFFASILLLAIAFHACDIVEHPVLEPLDTPTDTTSVDTTNTDTTGNGPGTGLFPVIDTAKLNTSYKVVMVEEFTGHTCQQCPGNTEKLVEIYESKKARMVLVSIHAGTFAELHPEDGYDTDFRTDYGNDIHDQYVPSTSGYPCAMVNRAVFPDLNNSQLFVSYLAWNPPIEESLGGPIEIALGVAAVYDEKANKFYVRASAKGTQSIDSKYLINILCIEDEVVAPQKDVRVGGDKYVEDYKHKHVLRGRLNSNNNLYGENFIDGTMELDEWKDYTLEVDVPESVEDPTDCTIVAFLVDAATQEIIQAEDAKVFVR